MSRRGCCYSVHVQYERSPCFTLSLPPWYRYDAAKQTLTKRGDPKVIQGQPYFIKKQPVGAGEQNRVVALALIKSKLYALRKAFSSTMGFSTNLDRPEGIRVERNTHLLPLLA